MKMKQVSAAAVCAALVTGLSLGWAPAQTTGADGARGDGGSSSTIDVHGCWVKLVHQAMLASDRPGIIAFVPDEGDLIQRFEERDGKKVDKPVARLRATVAEAALAAAEIEAKNDVAERFATAAQELAIVELQKAEDSNRRFPGAVPQIEIERLKLEIKKAKLQIEKEKLTRQINEKKRDQAAAELDSYYVFPKFDGMVRRVHKQVGEAVRQGDPILEIVNADRVYIEGYIYNSDRRRVKHGTYVTVALDESEDRRFAGAEQRKDPELPGKIVFIDTIADQVTGKIRVKAEVENPMLDDGQYVLTAGLEARMTIHPGRMFEKPATAAAER